MKFGRFILVALFSAVILSYFGFDSGGSHKSKTAGLTSIVLYSNESSFGNHDSLKAGKLQYRMNQWIVWAGTNNDNVGTDTTNVSVDSTDPESGAADIHWHVANGPNPRFWMLAVYHGGTPIDASNTGRVTFWIRAKAGSHPIWFWAEDGSYNGSMGQSANINVSGARVFSKGKVIVDEPFNGRWQFVSLPWSLIRSSDTNFVKNTFPGSWTHQNQFDFSMVRDIQFDSHGMNPDLNVAGGQGWIDDYYIDQIQFVPEATGVTGVKEQKQIPVLFKLDQNYPNPFNPTTQITYALPTNVRVSLDIYNIMGQKVRTLVANKMQSPGTYTVQWDSRNDHGQVVPSGVYLYRLQASHFVSTKKMVLLK